MCWSPATRNAYTEPAIWGKNNPTDVLSFPSAQVDAESRRSAFAGEIAVWPILRAKMPRGGTRGAAEVKVLALHGILHLAGMDHERDNGGNGAEGGELRGLRLPSTSHRRAEPAASFNAQPPEAPTKLYSLSAEDGMTISVVFALLILTGCSPWFRMRTACIRNRANFFPANFRTILTYSNRRSSPHSTLLSHERLFRWRCWRN